MKKTMKYLIMAGVVFVFMSGCASWDRTKKSFSSEFTNGIERTLVVKNQLGDVVYEDSGKFDIEVNDYRVKYIDEKDKLHIIYLGASTAVVSEK